MQVLSANGVSKVTAEIGQKLDPNLHEAMFDVPNPDAEPGSIMIIVKVCRPAQHVFSMCTCPQLLTVRFFAYPLMLSEYSSA